MRQCSWSPSASPGGALSVRAATPIFAEARRRQSCSTVAQAVPSRWGRVESLLRQKGVGGRPLGGLAHHPRRRAEAPAGACSSAWRPGTPSSWKEWRPVDLLHWRRSARTRRRRPGLFTQDLEFERNSASQPDRTQLGSGSDSASEWRLQRLVKVAQSPRRSSGCRSAVPVNRTARPSGVSRMSYPAPATHSRACPPRSTCALHRTTSGDLRYLTSR